MIRSQLLRRTAPAVDDYNLTIFSALFSDKQVLTNGVIGQVPLKVRLMFGVRRVVWTKTIVAYVTDIVDDAPQTT